MVGPSPRTAVGPCGAVVEPLGRERMAQARGALEGGMEPGPRQGAAHERPEALAVGASPAGGPHPDQDRPRRAPWSPGVAGGDERCADRRRQREAIRAGSLPPAAECSGVPSQLLSGQGHHCTGPYTAPGHQAQNRVRAVPLRGAPVAAL